MNIFGPTTISVEAAQAWARSRNAHPRFVAVIPIYLETSPRYNIPAENAIGQASHETADGHYTGVLSPDFHNWCGLKTKTGGSNEDPEAHTRFPDDRTGVLAHVQHLARYGGAQEPAEGDALVDPRWSHVSKFTDTIEGLGGPGSWAPSPTYGIRVRDRIQSLIDFAGNHDEEPSMALTDSIAQRIRDKGVEVHDIRGRMRRHATDRYRRLPNTAWLYTAVHHSAVPRGVRSLQGDIDSWVGHSVYHVNTHGWPGIAYAIGVSLSGRVFILRDIEEEGFHAFTANNNSIGICGDLTTGNTITEPFKRSLNAVLEVLHAAPEFPNLKDRAGTYGHRELAFVDQRNSGTACPGDVLPLVREYRAGRDAPAQPSQPPAIPKARPDPWGTDYWIPEIFIHEIGAQEWLLTGYAKSEAFAEDGKIVQYFERARLELQPDGSVTRGLVGTEAMLARYPERG